MEQLNNVLPAPQEEIVNAAGIFPEVRPQSPLLMKVRQNFGIYGGISLIFGGIFAVLFYKTWIGINVTLFTGTMITLLMIINKKLTVHIKAGTRFYYAGAFLLGISSFLTSNPALLILNFIGILILLDLSLLHQFYEDRRWDFSIHLGKMLGLILYSIASLGMPFVDFANFLKKIKFLKNNQLRNVMIGFIFSLPFVIIILMLLSDADLLFGKLTKNILNAAFSADILLFTFMLFFGFIACYCILCGTLSRTGQEEKLTMIKADASIAVTFMVILCMIYAIFCGIQLIYLFTGGLFALPSDFTFAEYARRGFFQLLAITIVNIAIILVCRTFFQESRGLRILITFMTACTYIMIASATYRMLLYIGAYHLTFLRLFVLLSLLIDALVLAGVIISEYKKNFPLFHYSIAVITICYLLFSFARPDSYIASYLSNHEELLGVEDMRYLTQDLSLDAAPYVLKLINEDGRFAKSGSDTDSDAEIEMEYKNCILDYYNRIENAKANTALRDFNYSNYKAYESTGNFPNN